MKKGYKRLQRRLLNETFKRIEAEKKARYEKICADNALEEAEYYRERFRKFGSNVKTADTEGKVICLKWELTPERWGNYATVCDVTNITPEMEELIVSRLSRQLTEGIVKRNLAQIIRHSPEDPFNMFGALGIKLYIVPWEQMPHENRIEMRQFALREAEMS
ncbi:MAG: hypothetical protein K6F61_04100 [Clostridiales bacterium]|nr:hypothetical protein [Clostridiales bacterium]